jgi:hypothetical protein
MAGTFKGVLIGPPFLFSCYGRTTKFAPNARAAFAQQSVRQVKIRRCGAASNIEVNY